MKWPCAVLLSGFPSPASEPALGAGQETWGLASFADRLIAAQEKAETLKARKAEELVPMLGTKSHVRCHKHKQFRGAAVPIGCCKIVQRPVAPLR